MKTGEIHSRCLIRYDDSHQVHSSELIIELDYQAWKTTMKKLEHCVKLSVTGPIDIEGLAKSYIDNCVNYGLNHQKTRHALELVVAVVGDVYGGYGSLTAAKVADYVRSAAAETLDCLSDSDKLSKHVTDDLKAKFNATVNHESHWVYWDL